MLNEIQRRRILEQPAREDLVPAHLLVGTGPFLYEDLNEGPLFLRLFPRERTFASRNFDDHIADPARLARLHDKILRQVVTLVQQAQRNNAVLHRRAGQRSTFGDCGSRSFAAPIRNDVRYGGFFRRRSGFAAASRQKRARDERNCYGPSERLQTLHPMRADQASGDQAS